MLRVLDMCASNGVVSSGWYQAYFMLLEIQLSRESYFSVGAAERVFKRQLLNWLSEQNELIEQTVKRRKVVAERSIGSDGLC